MAAGFWTSLARPRVFARVTRWMLPLLLTAGGGLLVAGIWQAFIVSPPDYQQGETVRIMYIHVPAATISMGLYVSMAIAAAVSLIWRHMLADLFCRAAALPGAVLTLICLVTGSLWGLPTWGTWWVWDARLTSVLILFFLYLGYIGLADAFDRPERGEQAGAILLLVGVINIPVIRFSVDWWNSIHQPASIIRKGGISIDPSMLIPLGLMFGAVACLAGALILIRMEAEILRRRIAAREARLAQMGEA
ncbi:MAG: heme ABC transporter permease [Alphaproteobacteria bacterium]